MTAPRASRLGTAWLVAPEGPHGHSDLGYTGIWHSDLDCPAVSGWVAGALHGHELIEVDPATGVILVKWMQTSPSAVAEWETLRIYGEERFHPDAWRSCLRCGSVSTATPVTVCHRCYLTTCDCGN